MKVIVVAPESFLGPVEGGASVEVVKNADRAGTLRYLIPSAGKETGQ